MHSICDNMCKMGVFVPNKLGVIMWPLRQQFKFSPVQKLMQRCEGVLGDCTLIGITPHLQSHQSYTDVQHSVELREHIIHLLTQQYVWTLANLT